MNPTLLRLQHIDFSYHTLHGETKALSDVSFTVTEGEFLAIVGPSGCGKSTLLSMIAGLIMPESGTITFAHDSPRIGYMLQQDHLLPWRTIWSNILLGPEIQKNLTPDKKEKAMHLLTDYGLLPFKDKHPNELSGGMRQRVMIAMALACEPDILIADEPTTALDVTIQAQILELMQDLQKKLGMAIIMVTHDLGVIASMCDEIIVMYGGRVCERGTADDIFYRPCHEYTKGLLRSIPRKDNMNERLVPIGGTPINLLNMPKGCAFCPRCEAAMKICLDEVPQEIRMSDTHLASCWMNVKKMYEAQEENKNE